MKIEEGKCYRTREGKKVGPMERRHCATSYPWISPKGSLYRENGKRYEGADEPNTDLISEWKEEPAMDYAMINEFLEYLHELRSIKRTEFDEKVAEIAKLDSQILKIESQYPKPDEEEK